MSILKTPEINMEIIPHQGMSFESLLRGLIGMLILVLIAYLLSNNRKEISWKLVGIGLLAQVSIAVGVIKISVIKGFFGFVSSFFVKILEYTNAGTSMLLGEFANIDKYGFIFIFQALPIIIFFSALTSILFYFGIIQKVVQFLAWALKKTFGYLRCRKPNGSWKYLFGADRGTTANQGVFGKDEPFRDFFGDVGRNGDRCG